MQQQLVICVWRLGQSFHVYRVIGHEGACLQVQPTVIEGKEKKINLPNPAKYPS
jgi:hypothetical protein